MNTVFNILKFEIKERLFSWLSLVFFLMLVFQGVWYTKGTFDYYTNDGVLMNAPAIFYRNFAGIGMLMVIIIAIVTGGVLYKDIQHKTSGWIYTMPVNEKSFFIGRYLAAFIYLLILSSGYFIGMVIVPYSGIGEPIRFGPTPFGQMFHAWAIFIVPSLLLFTSVIFAALVFSKKMMVGYLASFLLVILFLVMISSYESGNTNSIVFLADPMGFVATENYFEYLNTEQKNTDYIKLEGYLSHNRIFWAAITVLLLIISYFKFSFKDFINATNTKNKKIADKNEPLKIEKNTILKPEQSFSTSDFIVKLFYLSKLELLKITRPGSFKIILGILSVMIIMQNLMWNASYYIGAQLPTSSYMTFFRLAWGLFIAILLIIWAGELFFKDRVVNIGQIMDTMPVPVWVYQGSKLLAMIALAFILSILFIGIGIISQIIMGGIGYIDINRYIVDVLGFRWGWINFVLIICLSFFVAGVTGNRFLSHILSVGYLLIIVISFDMGLFEQLRYGYAMVPGVEDFSEISEYGILNISAFWYALMWFSLAIALVLIGIQFWNRGTDKNWRERLSLRGNQLNLGSKIITGLLLVVFFALQSFIDKQVHETRNFISTEEDEFLKSSYERQYKYLETKAHPKYGNINLEMDFYPENRKVEYKADILLQNHSGADTLFLNFDEFILVNHISINGNTIDKLKEDPLLGIYVTKFLLSTRMTVFYTYAFKP